VPLPLRLEDPGRLLSAELAEHVGERVRKLEHFCGWIRRCRVVVDGPGEHPLPGRYRVRVHLLVGKSRIVIDRRAGPDLPAAIRDSFDAADQRVEDHVRISRGSAAGAKNRRSRRRRT
jgi:hypothetical protein